MSAEQILLRRIKWLTWFFIIGLLISGVTAIPLAAELRWLVQITGAETLIESLSNGDAPSWAVWLTKVESAISHTAAEYPFISYGTDWLAFGHFVIAVAFVGALRDPVRNRWLFDFGLIACVLVIPYAFVFGVIRGIPFWWRLIDCSFGILGFVPLWFCRIWTQKLEQ